MKKMIAFWLALTMLLSLAACSKSDAGSGDPAEESETTTSDNAEETNDGESLLIGVSFGTLQEERWDAERQRMQELDEADDSWEMVYTDADTDASLQNEQIENMISQGIDVLVIGPQDNEAAAAAVDAAKEAGIPVVSYCRVVNSDKLDVVVSYDYVTIGEENMKMALSAVPEGNYVLVNGHDADSIPHDINTGYHNVIDSYVEEGKINIVFDQYINNWSPDEAMAQVENVLTQYDNDIQAIICNNDGMAGGAIQALIAQGLEGKVFVAGMDAELAACQRVAEGTQSTTIITGYDPLADAVIQAALELGRGEELSGINSTTTINGKDIPTVSCDPIIVTKDNLKEEVIDSGFRALEDVYANVPEDQWP